MPTPCPTQRDEFVMVLGTAEDGFGTYLRADEMARHIAIYDELPGARQWENALLREVAVGGGSYVCIDLWPNKERVGVLMNGLRAAGRTDDLIILDPANPTRETWNPLLSGSPEEVAVKLKSLLPSGTLTRDDRAPVRRALAAIVAALEAGKMAYSLRDVAVLLRHENARAELEERMPASDERNTFGAWCAHYKHAPQTLVVLLEKLAERIDEFVGSDCGAMLNVDSPSLDLCAAVREGKCVYLPVSIAHDPEAKTLLRLYFRELMIALCQRDATAAPVMICMSDAARHVAVDKALLGKATAAGVCLVGSMRPAEANEDTEDTDFVGELMRGAGTKLLGECRDYMLRLTTGHLGLAADSTLVYRDNTMQLVHRPSEEVALPYILPKRRGTVACLQGRKALGVGTRENDFVPKPRSVTTQPRRLYAVRV